jgi:four helix bundle protein
MPHTIARQLLRAGTSIGANLAEAKGAQSRRDTTARFSIALKEAKETQYWLRLITATRLAPAATVAPVLKEATELVAILMTARRKLKEQDGVTDGPKKAGRG